MATRRYEVVSPLRHDGKDYQVGKMVELEEDEAATLLGHTVRAPAAPSAPEKEGKGGKK